jgi:uncharacterized protein (TIGR02284 family)
MERSDRRGLTVLKHLYRIAEAGERGYALAAANVRNRGLKVLFKSRARQREGFKNELFAEMRKLGMSKPPSASLLAAIHRGRIDIFAAMTIGAENIERVVVKEVHFGERIAARAYRQALEVDLPADLREVITRQAAEIKLATEEARVMRGRGGKRLLVRLYDSASDARRAIQRLQTAGYPRGALEDQVLVEDFPQYEGRGTTWRETVLSGAAGGAFWGTVIGVFAQLWVFRLPPLVYSLSPESRLAPVWVLALLAFVMPIVAGAFIGGMLGMFIGWGVASGDKYLYEDGLKKGQILLRLMADEPRAGEASAILQHVNSEARARGQVPAHTL